MTVWTLLGRLSWSQFRTLIVGGWKLKLASPNCKQYKLKLLYFWLEIRTGHQQALRQVRRVVKWYQTRI